MEADIRVLKETDPKKQRSSQLDKELRWRSLAFYEDILKDKKRTLSRKSSVLDFFKSR
jgi:Sec7-like guanine-nucleotide exchange factor